MKNPKIFRRNPSPEKSGQKALAVIQDLSWGSILPLLSVYFKQGPFSIYYLKTSRGGLRLGALLFFLKVIVSIPLKIDDLVLVDSPHSNYWKIQCQAVRACSTQFGPIEALIQKHLPKCTVGIRKLLTINVIRMWQLWVAESLLLLNLGKQLGEQERIPNDCVVLISKYASLLIFLSLGPATNNSISILFQSNSKRVLLFPVRARIQENSI